MRPPSCHLVPPLVSLPQTCVERGLCTFLQDTSKSLIPCMFHPCATDVCAGQLLSAAVFLWANVLGWLKFHSLPANPQTFVEDGFYIWLYERPVSPWAYLWTALIPRALLCVCH